MRIAIVNDSVMAVESLRRVISSVADYEVSWIAHDGAEAVNLCREDIPDLVLMDLLMPVMDGVDATKKIMKQSPCAIVIVTATVSGNASKVFQAMGAGALDAVNTPVLGMSGDAEGKNELLAKIQTIGRLIKQRKPQIDIKPNVGSGLVPTMSSRLVAIGASSGGPHALASVLSSLPKNFPIPIVIVQHVDAQFAPELARWLDEQCDLKVSLAKVNDVLKAGQVLVAGGGEHLVMGSDGRLAYTAEPREQSYCPSVDVFFGSLVDMVHDGVVAVLLTGMGRDGAQGLLHLREKGVHTIAQDQQSCAVYGMPKAAAQLNAATEILSIDDIGAAIVAQFRRDATEF